MQLSRQTLEDLEFPEILENIATFSFNEKTAQLIRELQPYEDHELLIKDLKTTNEYLSSFESENRIPFSEFYYMSDFLPRLNIENYYLDVEQFFQIKSNALQIKEITKFLLNSKNIFQNYRELFPKSFMKMKSLRKSIMFLTNMEKSKIQRVTNWQKFEGKLKI